MITPRQMPSDLYHSLEFMNEWGTGRRALPVMRCHISTTHRGRSPPIYRKTFDSRTHSALFYRTQVYPSSQISAKRQKMLVAVREIALSQSPPCLTVKFFHLSRNGRHGQKRLRWHIRKKQAVLTCLLEDGSSSWHFHEVKKQLIS